MEIALALLAVLAILIGYQFYMKHTASSNSVEEAKPEIKEEVVAEVKAVEVETKTEVAPVAKAAKKAAAPKVKTAAKKVDVAEEVVTAAKKTVKKPKIKIAK
jgi:hypothetical protein